VDELTRAALRARAGDDQALEEFVELAYEQVWRFCASLGDRQATEDLVQEVFVRAVRALPRFRADASARTWLLAIARHACMDDLRSRTRRRREAGTLAAGTPRDELVAADAAEHAALADLVRRLEPERRAAFVLTQVLGLSYDEAAEVCGCPLGTIRSRVARARVELLELLDGRARVPRRARREGWSS